jgi:hypothetical protein
VKVRPHAEGAVIVLEAPGDLPQRADLGLALARRFIELHGGRIWYEPRPDATAILVMLPAERTADVWTPVPTVDTAGPAAV